MAGVARSLTLAARASLCVIAAAGCAPEVVIARSNQAGGSGGAPIVAGTSGSEASGTGAAPAAGGAGGEAGQVSAEAPRLLADSVADFSLEQGKLGWQYGYDGGTLDGFALLTRIGVIRDYVPATNDVWDCWGNDETRWTQIFQLGAHPNGTDTSEPSNAILQRAVRRWISTFEGDVVISGEMAKIDVAVGGSNGIDASVYVDGMQRYSAFIGGEDGGGLSYEVMASLHVGSTVDFVLDPHEGADHHDLSRFTAVIARSEAPQTQ